jgi:hypothetical protein
MANPIYGAEALSPLFNPSWLDLIPERVQNDRPSEIVVLSGGTGSTAITNGQLLVTPSTGGGSPLAIPFKRIESFYTLGITTARAKIFELTCTSTCLPDPNCYIQVRKWDGFSDQIPNEREYSTIIGGLVDCSQNCTQKIDSLIAAAALDPKKWVTLTRIGTDKLRVTGPVGVDFDVFASGCFTVKEVVQDICTSFGTCADFKKMGAPLGCGCDNSDTTAFKVIGIEYEAPLKIATHGTFAGLKPSDNAHVYVRKIAWVAFQNTVNNTQYDALIALLTNSSNERLDIFGSTTAVNTCSSLVTSSSTTA